jgi:DNA-binding transcriptional MerR regulator/methylmalonyl-CoA mutase cobalamin-binding subunit
MYSIKAVSQATGLSVETLRAWERRYGLVVPQRDELGRRVYRPDDVLRLRRLREATDLGHAIGRVALLDDARLADLIEAQAQSAAAARSGGAAYVARILQAAVDFHSDGCEQALTLAIAMLPPQRLIDEVLQPLLYEVGERWHRGELTIAQERLVSSAVRKHVSLVLDAYDRCARGAAIVFATLPGERHELGLLMSAMLCASRGFKVRYLGAELPPEEIARYAGAVEAAVVALSVVMLDLLPEVPAQLANLAARLGPGVPIWLGGAALHGLAADTLPAACVVIQDPLDLESRLGMLAA